MVWRVAQLHFGAVYDLMAKKAIQIAKLFKQLSNSFYQSDKFTKVSNREQNEHTKILPKKRANLTALKCKVTKLTGTMSR